MADVENLLITRTGSGEEYCETLSRIRYFVSADVGMGEYMIKNFEAMACGCVLFAYDQGEAENRALGFVDMQNIVLYRTRDELREKLAVLRASSQLAEAISLAGQALVEQRYTFRAVGHAIVDAMRAPLRERVPLSWKEKLRLSLGL